MKKSEIFCVVILKGKLGSYTSLQALENVNCIVHRITHHYLVLSVGSSEVLRVVTIPPIRIKFKELSCSLTF